MFDIAPSELLLVAVVALVVIGPKDLPRALRLLGQWVGRARGVARQFRAGFDNMVREAELAEMEKKWAEENRRIMQEHGAGAASEAGLPAADHDATSAGSAAPAAPSDGVVSSQALDDAHVDDGVHPVVMVEQPHVAAAPVPVPAGAPAHRPDDALS